MSFNGIITADWHLRKDVPIARPEDEEEWIGFQFSKVALIHYFAEKNKLDIYCNGDLFDRSQPYYGITNRLIAAFKDFRQSFYKIAGNHDLPYHAWDNAINSGWYASAGTDMTESQKGSAHFGTKAASKRSEIIFTHQLTFPNEKSKPPMAGGKTAQELLDEFPNAKWIFTGDYHKAFHYENNGRHVVNPGCLTRQSVTEEDYDTGFYEVHTDTEEVIFHSVGDTIQLKTEHLQKSKERESRIDAFMEIVKETGKVSLSFKDNLKKKLLNKKIPQGVKNIIIEIEEEIGV